jgi:hypothetical protein
VRRRPYHRVIARAGRAVLPLLVLAAAAVVPAAPARAYYWYDDYLTIEACGPQPRGTDRPVKLVVTNHSAPISDVSVAPAEGMPPGIVVHDVGAATPYIGYRQDHEYAATVSVAADAPPGLVSLPFDVTTSAGTVRVAASYVVSGPVGAPAVTTVTPGDGRAVVEWQPPPAVYGWDVSSYVVTAHPGGATTTPYQTTHATVAGLENGTAYTFTVTARSATGETTVSPPSDPVTPAGPPLPPEGVAATGSGTSRVVSWEAAADSGSPVTGYTVTTYPGGVTTDAAPDARSVEVTGLDAGTTYEFTVHATNAAGTGDESLSTAGGPANGLPGPFTGTLTLSAPPDADGYFVTVTVGLAGLGPDGTYYEVDDGLGSQFVFATGGRASISYGERQIGTTQAFRVREANSYIPGSGAGPWSARSAVTPTGAASIRDVFLLGGDGGLHACPFRVTDRGVPATALIFRAYDGADWHAPDGPALGTWTLPPDTLDAWLPLANTVRGYVVDVQVVTALGPGPRTRVSAPAWPKGLPGTPADVAATAGDRSAAVTWSAAYWNGSGGEYEVVASPGGATVRTSELSAQVGGLAPGTAYTFAVRALNEVGYGFAATSAAVTPYGPPGAPPDVTASSRNGAAPVTWTAAAANYSPLDHYTVTASPGGATAVVAGDALAAEVGGLANGTAYTFTVTAANAAGDGAASEPSNAVTPDGTAPAVTLHALAPVTLSGSVRLSYAATDAGGSGVASAVARYRAAPYGGGFGAFHALGAATSMPLARGYTYCFSAAATDVAGNVSRWTAERCTVVPLDDRALAASPSWTRGAGASHYAGTYTTTVYQGAALTRTGVSGRRLVLVYATVSNGATLGVYFNGVLVKRVPTAIMATAPRQVVTVDLGAVRSGTVTIRTLTGGRAFVDGLGVSRV